MMIPIPANEHYRLEAVHLLSKTAADQAPALQELVRLASQIFDVPMAMVSMIDETRQIPIVSTGVGFDNIARPVAICSHTLLKHQVLVVPDAALDDRFHQNPMVTSPPHIRFYAGAPLVLPEGFAIGTISLMDTRPRPSFDAAERDRLLDLAGAAVAEINGRPERAAAGEPPSPELDRGDVETGPSFASGAQAQFSAFTELAHDINAGLNEILRASDALEEALPDIHNPQFHALIDRIQASASYVHRVADRTLELARLRGGAAELNEGTVDLVDIIDSTIDRGQNLADGKSICLTAVPMTGRPIILADKILLEQMITILMTNAIVHSEPGAKARCKVSSTKTGDLMIAVRNAGACLTREEISRAFKPFHTLQSSLTEPRAAGLGLPIARKLIEMHGGMLDLVSRAEIGVEARLLFPTYRVLSWFADSDPNSPSTI